jgi:hypothetical protein
LLAVPIIIVFILGVYGVIQFGKKFLQLVGRGIGKVIQSIRDLIRKLTGRGEANGTGGEQ